MDKNYTLSPTIVAREIVMLISHLTGRYNIKTKSYHRTGDSVSYDGAICNIRDYKNDANFYFDIYFGDISFTLSFPMFDNIWQLSIDDFAEYKLIPELYKKLDYYGYATWD